jgi:amino acid adenylation domain-containing protein
MSKPSEQTDTVVELVAAQVASAGDRPAVVDMAGRQLTYRELWWRAGRLARELAEAGVERGQPVLLGIDRSIEMVVAILGVARAGGWYVLLETQAPPERNQLIQDEVGAVIVVDSADQPDVPVPSGLQRLTLSPRDPVPTADPAQFLVPDGDSADICYVAYTSGSTGRPKGVVAPHHAVTNFVRGRRLCRLAPGDRVASLSNPTSDATTFEIWSTLAAGATVVVLPHVYELTGADWPRVLTSQRVSAMFMMAGLVALVAAEQPAAFASLDTLVFGGEALPIEIARDICRHGPPNRLVLGYGPTETTVFATSFDCTLESLSGLTQIPLGTPLENYSLHIEEADLEQASPGQTGELLVGGPGVAAGYLGRPDLTAQRFVPGPTRDSVRYRTGDVVTRDEQGRLMFVSRVDRQVKVRGFRVELEEVERAVLATGSARTAVVEKVEDGYLACFYEPATDREDTPIELTKAISTRLPGYMIPARWVRLSSLPRTPNGKVDRARLLSLL